MRSPLPHWSLWPLGLFTVAVAAGGLILERQQTPASPPPVDRALPVTARARVGFVLHLPTAPQRRSAKVGRRGGVAIRVERGQVLVAAGTPMTPLRRRLLATAWRAGPTPSGGDLAARLALVAGLFALLLWLGGRLVRGARRLSLLLSLTAAAVLTGHLVKLYTDLPLACAPLALGALLAGLTLGRRAALVSALATVALAGLTEVVSGPALTSVALGCLVAGLLARHRCALSLALAAAVAGALQSGALALLAPVTPPFWVAYETPLLVVGAVGPWAAGAVALVLAWGVLRWAGVASAGRLRRLVAPRHPLLRELRRRAPGTYRHAQNVARLADAGARAIGGDRPLLRAGAWYHDLGKLLGSEVFAENRPRGADPHEDLSPEESARRIARHVPDGLRLARRYRLPAELWTLIAQHHGTGAIGGPLQRARQEGRDIDPAVYYYPGPLPDTRSAAILMVCDAVEATSRRLDDASLAAVSEVVEEVVDCLMSEYQFEDCDLTQDDLVTLAGALTQTLRRALGRRVEPEQGAPKHRGAPEAP